MTDGGGETKSVADFYLELLASRGIDYFFGNAGTDFAPIIEAFAKAQALGLAVPRPITVPHENLTVAMAMGVTMVTGRPQAVMLHTNVGMANGLCQLLNSSRLNLPMLFTSGRTPVNEDAVFGGRSIDIHWTQEMFDQGGMAREAVKWDYELRNPGQVETVVDRALSISKSAPAGPVYLILPREVLAAEMPAGSAPSETPPATASPAHPDPDAIQKLAGWTAEAAFPLIVTSTLGRDPGAVAVLGALADEYAIPVVQSRPRTMNLRGNHPMNLGTDPGEFIGRADLILAIDCEVPWIPSRNNLKAGCRVVHIGEDPLFEAIPIRGFRSDLAIKAVPRAVLTALGDALGQPGKNNRRRKIAEIQSERAQSIAGVLDRVRHDTPIDSRWLSHCLGQIADDGTLVMREAELDLDHYSLAHPGSLFGGSSGLGWSLGGAMGAKLAKPESTIIAAVGDGGYMYGNPVAAHYVSAALGVPFLTVIFNNQSWQSVRRATLAMYPGGFAAKANDLHLTDLKPSPAFENVVTASGGHGERVEDPAEVADALTRALRVVREEGRQAVLNVICD